MSVGTASASLIDHAVMQDDNSIISISGPDLRVTVYDGIATLIGTANTFEEAQAAEQQIHEVAGIEHVINLITWG